MALMRIVVFEGIATEPGRSSTAGFRSRVARNPRLADGNIGGAGFYLSVWPCAIVSVVNDES